MSVPGSPSPQQAPLSKARGSWRMLGIWSGATILLATLAPIPLWLVIMLSLSAGGDPFQEELWEAPIRTPNPKQASSGMLSPAEQLVYLDPWLGALYPPWAVLGTIVGLTVLLTAWFYKSPAGNCRRWPTMRQSLLLMLLLIAWGAIPFLVGLAMLSLTSTPDWQIVDPYSAAMSSARQPDKQRT